MQRAPQHVHRGRRHSLSGRRRERTRKLAAAYTLNKMRNGVHQESAAEKFSNVQVPAHGFLRRGIGNLCSRDPNIRERFAPFVKRRELCAPPKKRIVIRATTPPASDTDPEIAV